MGQLVFQATLGGQVNLVGPNTASTFNINVPATTGTMVTTGDSGTVTSTMLATSVYTAPGTIGSGTANTGAFTSLSYTTTLTGGTGIIAIGTNQIYKDANGLIGIKGVASTSWSSTYQVIQYNGGPALWSANNTNINLSSNIYNDGTSRYITSTTASNVNASVGQVALTVYQSGTAGNAVTAGAGFLVSLTDCTMTTANGGLGYSSGAGGTVTQATSKGTTVTLNKPTGQITMNNAALLPSTSVNFQLNNSLLAATDALICNASQNANYTVQTLYAGAGSAGIRVTNITAGSLSEALVITFAIIKGATS